MKLLNDNDNERILDAEFTDVPPASHSAADAPLLLAFGQKILDHAGELSRRVVALERQAAKCALDCVQLTKCVRIQQEEIERLRDLNSVAFAKIATDVGRSRRSQVHHQSRHAAKRRS